MLALVAAGCLLLGEPAAAVDWTYTVRPADNLWNLAAKYCGSSRYWARIAAHNQLATPHDLTPGERIRIPVGWLVKQPATARVAFAQGEVVEIRPDGSTRPATDATIIVIGQALRTGSDGYATIAFADQSELTLGPDSEVVFDLLAAFGDTGMVDTRVRLERGRSESQIRPASGEASGYRIDTPLGVAAVRGTRFRVRSTGALYNETVEGSVAVQVPGQPSAAIDAGFGVVARATPGALVPEALLAAPVIDAATPKAIGEPLRWRATTDARSYLVQAYVRGDRTRPLAQWQVSGTELVPTGLAPGDYAFGVRAVAQSGLEGMEGFARIRLVTAPPVPAPAAPSLRGRSITLRFADDAGAGPYRIEVSPNTEFAEFDTYDATTTEVAIARPRAGRYYWRVARAEAAIASEAMPLAIAPLAPAAVAVSASQRRLQISWEIVPDASAYRVQVAGDPRFASVTFDEVVAERSIEVPATPGAYHVRVQSIAGDIEGEFTEPTKHQILRRANWWIVGGLVALVIAL